MDCISLIDIATQLGFSDLIAKLQAILERQNKDDAPLTLPLVGEFSSGKTTLINSLTNSHQLETPLNQRLRQFTRFILDANAVMP
jgi:hypothetical protein